MQRVATAQVKEFAGAYPGCAGAGFAAPLQASSHGSPGFAALIAASMESECMVAAWYSRESAGAAQPAAQRSAAMARVFIPE